MKKPGFALTLDITEEKVNIRESSQKHTCPGIAQGVSSCREDEMGSQAAPQPSMESGQSDQSLEEEVAASLGGEKVA